MRGDQDREEENNERFGYVQNTKSSNLSYDLALALSQPITCRLSATFAIVDMLKHYWLSCRLFYPCKCNDTIELRQVRYTGMKRPEMMGEGGFARKAEDEVLVEKLENPRC